MKLTDSQIETVKQWAARGETLAGIQRLLKDEMGLSLTYLDTRMLVADLGLQLEEWKPKPEAAKPVIADNIVEPAPEPAPAGVTVTTDAITRPGAVVSGRVTFSDGQRAVWLLDQMGRLGFDPEQRGYRPSAPDLQQFQAALDRELRKLGL